MLWTLPSMGHQPPVDYAHPGMIRSSCSSISSHPSPQICLYIRAGLLHRACPPNCHFSSHNNRDCHLIDLAGSNNRQDGALRVQQECRYGEVRQTCIPAHLDCYMLTFLGKSLSSPSTFAKPPALKRSRRNVRPQPPRHSNKAHGNTQASMFEHVSYTHGTIRALPRSGRA